MTSLAIFSPANQFHELPTRSRAALPTLFVRCGVSAEMDAAPLQSIFRAVPRPQAIAHGAPTIPSITVNEPRVISCLILSQSSFFDASFDHFANSKAKIRAIFLF